MPDFWDSFKQGMSRAYSPLASGLEQGTQAVFGPQAHFFPQGPQGDIELPPPPPEVAGVQEPPEVPDFSHPQLTDALNLTQARKDFILSEQGDKEARARLAALQGSPAVSALGAKKPGPLEMRTRNFPGMGELPIEMQTRNFSASDFQSPTQTSPQEAGGGGVQVQDQQKKHDWSRGLPALTVGLGDIFSALGNPRAQMGKSAGYELAKQQLQAQQMEALQRRHQMFDDAYQAAKALPAEIYTDERFSALRGAAQNILNSGDKGEVDNEKAVSAFLTEQARHKGDLDQLGLQTKARDQMQLEDLIARHRGGLTDLYGPSAGQQWQRTLSQDEERVRQFNENQQRQKDALAEQAKYRTEIARIQAASRLGAGQGRDLARAQAALGQMIESAGRRYAKAGPDGEVLNAPEVMARGLAENSDAIIDVARQAGVNFRAPGDPARFRGEPPDDNFYIQGKAYNSKNPAEAAQALSLLYQLARIE